MKNSCRSYWLVDRSTPLSGSTARLRLEEKTAATADTVAAAYCVAAFPERADSGSREEEARGRATAAWWEAAWEMGVNDSADFI